MTGYMYLIMHGFRNWNFRLLSFIREKPTWSFL